ncbi:MAG: thioredoxin family protein [Bacteroidota bacterium]
MKRIHSTILFASIVLLASFSPSASYKVGDPVSDFSLKNIDGKMVSMADYKTAKGFIVVFTCNHCPFAKLYQQRINDLNNEYATKGFPVLAINPNDVETVPEDSYENMIIRAKEKKFTFPYLIDETQDIAKAFNATKTPHAFIVFKVNGKLILKYAGAIDDNAQEPEKAKSQ